MCEWLQAGGVSVYMAHFHYMAHFLAHFQLGVKREGFHLAETSKFEDTFNWRLKALNDLYIPYEYECSKRTPHAPPVCRYST